MILVKEKKFNPDFWKPVGFKQVEIKNYSGPGKSTGGFLPYQDPATYYEVRGIMPSSKNKTLITEEENVKKKVRKIED